MKKRFFAAVIAVMALTASVNASNAPFRPFGFPFPFLGQPQAQQEFVLSEIAGSLDADNAYRYTLLCQRFLNEAKQIKSSDRLTETQKQNRIENLKGIYTDRFSVLLDSQQTESTIEELALK